MKKYIESSGLMETKVFCTVFTPTYNRKETLPRLYKSLTTQKCKDFEWVIVDDGSTDGTREYIEQIIQESKLKIYYYYQNNSGKHVAINTGLEHANGQVFAIVDSDDYLTNDAITKIKSWFSQMEEERKDIKFAGVAGQKGYSENEAVGSTFSGDFIDSKNTERNKHGITGDKFEIFYTSVLKANKFPVFDSEKFITEMVVWNRLARQNYYIRYYQDIIYLCEYLEDGLTNNILKYIANSPKGYALNIKEQVKYDNLNLKQKLSNYSLYYAARKSKANLKQIASELETNQLMIVVSVIVRKIYESKKRKK